MAQLILWVWGIGVPIWFVFHVFITLRTTPTERIRRRLAGLPEQPQISLPKAIGFALIWPIMLLVLIVSFVAALASS